MITVQQGFLYPGSFVFMIIVFLLLKFYSVLWKIC